MAERVIFNGEAGTTWTNDTAKVRYQFVCAFINTCGACLQYHLAIGPWWPIQIHHRCRCKQYEIAPGAEAPHPFVDFRELLDSMSRVQQAAAVGASNYKLLQAGVVTWKEVVTQFRVRTLREVLALNKVSLDTALKAGVKPGWIKAAHEAVHTPEAELIRQHRAELIEKLKARGVQQEQLVHEISRGLVGQVQIQGVATGAPQSMAPFAANIPHAEGLAAALAGWKRPPRKRKPPPAEPGPPAGPAPVPAPKPPAGPTVPPAAVPAAPQPAIGQVPVFHEQVSAALADVPAVRLVGNKAWIHDVHAAHQANPANPRHTLDEFKRLLLEDENRSKLTLGRADLAHRMNQADVAASETEYRIGERKLASFNFIRPAKALSTGPAPAPSVPAPKPKAIVKSTQERARETIDSAVKHAEEAGYETKLVTVEELVVRYGYSREKATRTVASYASGGKILINRENTYWTHAEAQNKKQHEEGWLSSAQENRVIDHEIGHSKHHESLGNAFTDSELRKPFTGETREMIEREVSRLATWGITDFVAEVYTAMRAGTTYNEEVMNLYRRYMGPKP